MGKVEPLILKITVIIRTSNLGSDIIQRVKPQLITTSKMKALVMGQVGQHTLDLNSLNRIDDAVVFPPLGREQIKSIRKNSVIVN